MAMPDESAMMRKMKMMMMVGVLYIKVYELYRLKVLEYNLIPTYLYKEM